MRRRIAGEDIEKFAEVTGDVKSLHLDDEFAKNVFNRRIAYGMLTASVISNLLGNVLPARGLFNCARS